MGFENFWKPKSEARRQLSEGLAELEDERRSKTDDASKDERAQERVPADLVVTSAILEKHGISLEEIYEWYATAIARRDRAPIEAERFTRHFSGASTEPTFAFGERENGYVLGFVKYGVFVPTHFAPKTLRGGYELLKRLGESTVVPAVMSITEDLRETLSKMPSWHVLDVSFLAPFRAELVKKDVVYNSHPDTKNLMLGLISEYLEESKERSSGSN
jgi:hypothetical protein